MKLNWSNGHNNSSSGYQNFEALESHITFTSLLLIAYLPNARHRKPMALKNYK